MAWQLYRMYVVRMPAKLFHFILFHIIFEYQLYNSNKSCTETTRIFTRITSFIDYVMAICVFFLSSTILFRSRLLSVSWVSSPLLRRCRLCSSATFRRLMARMYVRCSNIDLVFFLSSSVVLFFLLLVEFMQQLA